MTSAVNPTANTGTALSKRKVEEFLKSALDLPVQDPYVLSVPNLYEKLATFKASTWFGKHKLLNAPTCALHGWTNVDVDKLQCPDCGSVLLIPGSFNSNLEEAKIWRRKLFEAHKEDCLQRLRVHDFEEIYKFPRVGASNALRWFKERYQEIALEEDLADFLHAPESLDKLKQLILVTSETEVKENTILLALFGWKLNKSKTPRTLYCSLCARSIPLIMQRNVARTSSSSLALIQMDPLSSHQHYCPWFLSGWKDTLDTLLQSTENPERKRDVLQNAPDGVGKKVKDTVLYVRELLEGKRRRISHKIEKGATESGNPLSTVSDASTTE